MAISGSPLLDTFTYHTDFPLTPGERVVVDFANRSVVAYVVEITDELPEFATKPVLQKLDEKPFLTSKDVELALRISERFLCPVGKIFDLFFPPGKVMNVKKFRRSAVSGASHKGHNIVDRGKGKFGAVTIENWKKSRKIRIVTQLRAKKDKSPKEEVR